MEKLREGFPKKIGKVGKRWYCRQGHAHHRLRDKKECNKAYWATLGHEKKKEWRDQVKESKEVHDETEGYDWSSAPEHVKSWAREQGYLEDSFADPLE